MLIIFIVLVYVITHDCGTPTCSLIINGNHQDILLVPRGVHSSCVSSFTRVPVRTIHCVGVNSRKLREASHLHLWHPLLSCFSL